MDQPAPSYFARLPDDDGRPAAELVDRYAAGPPRLRAAVEGMDRQALLARPEPGRLSSLEVLGHIADCDQYLADRMKRTIALERPLLIGADTNRYHEALAYQEREAAPLLALVEATRLQFAGDLRRLPGPAWRRAGLHTEVGLFTLRMQLLYTIKHLEGHAAAIQRKRALLGA